MLQQNILLHYHCVIDTYLTNIFIIHDFLLITAKISKFRSFSWHIFLLTSHSTNPHSLPHLTKKLCPSLGPLSSRTTLLNIPGVTLWQSSQSAVIPHSVKPSPPQCFKFLEVFSNCFKRNKMFQIYSIETIAYLKKAHKVSVENFRGTKDF